MIQTGTEGSVSSLIFPARAPTRLNWPGMFLLFSKCAAFFSHNPWVLLPCHLSSRVHVTPPHLDGPLQELRDAVCSTALE